MYQIEKKQINEVAGGFRFDPEDGLIIFGQQFSLGYYQADKALHGFMIGVCLGFGITGYLFNPPTGNQLLVGSLIGAVIGPYLFYNVQKDINDM